MAHTNQSIKNIHPQPILFSPITSCNNKHSTFLITNGEEGTRNQKKKKKSRNFITRFMITRLWYLSKIIQKRELFSQSLDNNILPCYTCHKHFFFLTMSCTNKDSTFLITNVEEGTRNPNKKKQELYCKVDDHPITVPSKDIPEKRAFSLSHQTTTFCNAFTCHKHFVFLTMSCNNKQLIAGAQKS